MEEMFTLRLRQMLPFLCLAVWMVGSQEAEGVLFVPGEYWKSILPQTPMPQAVQDLLPSEWEERKDADVTVGHGGVGVVTEKPGGGTAVGVGPRGVGVFNRRPGGGTAVGVGPGGVGVINRRPGGGAVVGVTPGGVDVGTRTKTGRPVIVRVHPGWNPFQYLYAATETQLKHDPNVALFFLQKDLHPGKKMKLDFSKISKGLVFLPRRVADSIPFSLNKLPQILERFSLKPSSEEAKTVKTTIEECEAKPMKGEEKFCATSLESMVDFSVSKLGRQLSAISTTAEGEQRKQYIITDVKKRVGNEAVVCHRQEYAYAVFLCHRTSTSLVYEVEMMAVDGSKADAVAVCHRDTAKWNPKHLAFQVLKVQPGSVPVCHFLPQDHVVWVPK